MRGQGFEGGYGSLCLGLDRQIGSVKPVGATYLDDDTGVLCGKSVSERTLDKQSNSLEMGQDLVCFREVYSRQFEQLGLESQLECRF